MLTPVLRQRVTIQQRTLTQNTTTGAVAEAWTTFLANVPAAVLTGPGREFEAANAKQAETTARIVTRWFSGLLPTHRIQWDGRVYDIQSIETDETGRREYRLRCTDGVNQGA